MPFTPFHLGPGLAIKAIAGNRFSFMVFGGSQVLMDIEPLVRIMQHTPTVHGLTHTVAGALAIGSVAGAIGKPISETVLRLLHVEYPGFTWVVSFVSAYVGTFSHVALDAMMHSDMAPWFPFTSRNPLLDVVSLSALHSACVVLAGFGLAGIFWRRGRANRA